MEICDQCDGTGISGHPDSNLICNKCAGSGGVTPAIINVRSDLVKTLGQHIYEDRYAAEGGVWHAVSDSSKNVWYDKAEVILNIVKIYKGI